VRVFNSDGSPASAELVVNTETPGQQIKHSVTTLADGRFVVTWKHETPLGPGLGSSQGLKAQVFNADGTPSGGNISVLDGSGIPTDTSVAALSNGGFVVSWSSQTPFGGADVGIQAQVFNANGSKLGDSFFVDLPSYGHTYSGPSQPNAVGLDNGRFLVTWSFQLSVYGAIFEPDGSLVGSPFDIAFGTHNLSLTSPPVVSSSYDGRFTVVLLTNSGDLVSQTFSAEIQPWTLAGTPNGETLFGDVFGDTISGLAGDDFLTGFGGNDILDGGDGSDIAFYDEKTASISVTLQETGDSTVSVGGVAEDTVRNIENLIGGSGADLLTGNSVRNRFAGNDGNDVLVLLGGDDYAEGGNGNDYLYMGEGNDSAVGDEGVDVFVLAAGDDTAHGGGGQDYIYGGAGEDALYGNDGVDVLIGEDGDDYFLGGADGDYVYGGSGDDFANGEEGNDIFVMGIGNDFAEGSLGQDYFYMGDGNDTARGGPGVDVFLGEAGNDRFVGDYFESSVDYAWGGTGNDAYLVGAESGVLVVQDFRAGGNEDALHFISDTGINTFAQVFAASTYYAGMNTTIVALDADTSVWLVGVNKTQLTTADFVFGAGYLDFDAFLTS
jgi:Ca2+-binding RTX toxin-like protein